MWTQNGLLLETSMPWTTPEKIVENLIGMLLDLLIQMLSITFEYFRYFY